jgi:hypothetical protein
MTSLCLSDDHHAGHHDSRLPMRSGIIDRLSPPVRAELTPTFSLGKAAIIWCSSRHHIRYPRISPNPPQPVHLAYIQHLGSPHSPLSPLYHSSAVSTLTSLSTLTYIHPFDLAPESSASASFPHIGTPPVSAASARSRVSQYLAGHHARNSSPLTSFVMRVPHPSGSAYATRRSPLASPNKPSSPSFTPPSPLVLRPRKDELTRSGLRGARVGGAGVGGAGSG